MLIHKWQSYCQSEKAKVDWFWSRPSDNEEKNGWKTFVWNRMKISKATCQTVITFCLCLHLSKQCKRQPSLHIASVESNALHTLAIQVIGAMQKCWVEFLQKRNNKTNPFYYLYPLCFLSHSYECVLRWEWTIADCLLRARMPATQLSLGRFHFQCVCNLINTYE